MPVFSSYKNQSIDLHSKSIDWFLYEGNTDGLKMPRPTYKRLPNLLGVGTSMEPNNF